MTRLRLAVIGVGAFGSELCRLLAEHSYEHILIIDPDRLEPRNVELSAIYQAQMHSLGPAVFGHFKADLLVDEINKRHGYAWQSLATEIADAGLARLSTCDLLVSCTDSSLARVETTWTARVLGLPMLDGGVMGDGVASGRVSWFAPQLEAACYLCGMTDVRRAEVLAYALSASLGCQLPTQSSAMTGTLDTLKRTAATMLRLIEETIPNEISSVRLLNACESGWAEQKNISSRSVTCPWHENLEGQWKRIAYDQPIQESISSAEVRVQFAWPHCLTSSCKQCNHHASPQQRVAFVRRKFICPECGALGSSEPIEVVSSFSARDSAADFTPRQLGLPQQHLYLFRRAFVPHDEEGS